MTDEVVLRNDADLIAARPLIASAVSGIVGGSAFRGLFRRAVLDAHRAIFTGDRDTLTLTLADVGTVIAAALEKLDPQLADQLDAGERVVLLKRDLGSLTGDAVRTGERLQRARMGAGGADAAGGRGRALWSRATAGARAAQLGAGVAAAGLTIVIAYTVARALLVGRRGARGVGRVPRRPARVRLGARTGAARSSPPRRASLIAPIEIEGLAAARRGGP